MKSSVTSETICEAYDRLKGVVIKTPLQLNKTLSKKYGANVYLKREDLQVVRSYKLRGAYNRISLLNNSEKKKGIVCASAGNHAQGVAFSCAKLKVEGYIFMPQNTPKQKIDRVEALGGKWITLELVGDTFDEAQKKASKFCKEKKKTFVHPFEDSLVISGQGTVALEIENQLEGIKPDYFFVPIGGGGLMAGLSIYVNNVFPKAKLIGVEPNGAPAMFNSLKKGEVITLDEIDKFVDGAAVKSVGKLNFSIIKKYIDDMLLVPEGKVCTEMIDLYQTDGIVTEPAGALSISALESYKNKIKGKTVICIVSGGNNDISRYPEIIEKSLVYRGLKHYFMIEFSQRPGSLKLFLNEALGPKDNITLFEYVKKSNRETGPALVGIELSKSADLDPLMKRMTAIGMKFKQMEADNFISQFVI